MPLHLNTYLMSSSQRASFVSTCIVRTCNDGFHIISLRHFDRGILTRLYPRSIFSLIAVATITFYYVRFYGILDSVAQDLLISGLPCPVK